MNLTRRHTLALTLGLIALPRLALAAPAQMTPDQVQALQAAGKSVFVDFMADWCGTCKAQEKVVGAILAEDPALAEQMTFALIDWDEFGDHPFTKALKIPRRSTLVKFNGTIEAGRLVAQTSRKQIEALIRA
jgi:thioredoxin 1